MAQKALLLKDSILENVKLQKEFNLVEFSGACETSCVSVRSKIKFEGHDPTKRTITVHKKPILCRLT